MKCFLLIFFVCSSSSLFAQTDLDERLKTYIKDFALSPITPPPVKKVKLFELGRVLFFETKISGNNNISCADCHHPRVRTQDNLMLGLGEGAVGIELKEASRLQKKGTILGRNTPPLFNLGAESINSYFWDGRVRYAPMNKIFITPEPDLNGENPVRSDITKTLTSGLAAQAIFPMVNLAEMRGKPGTNILADAKTNSEAWDLIVMKILTMPYYYKLFKEVFPNQKINIGHFGEAIAEFERQQFYLADTAYDRYLKGDVKALTLQQKRGMEIFFNKANCGNCHNGEHLSNFTFRNIFLPQIGPGVQDGDDLGRFQWSPNELLKYSFRVPPLRNVKVTGPYMHNGVFKTLREVINHYNDAAKSLMSFTEIETPKNYIEKIKTHDHKDDELRMSFVAPNFNPKLELTEEEKDDLEEFVSNGLLDSNFQFELSH